MTAHSQGWSFLPPNPHPDHTTLLQLISFDFCRISRAIFLLKKLVWAS